MTLSQILLPELDHEVANTRRAPERVPADRLDWSPHPKSMTRLLDLPVPALYGRSTDERPA